MTQISSNGEKMTHIVEEYKKWQPTYAAYDKWARGFYERDRQTQAIIEMVGEAGEVLQIVTKARRKKAKFPRDKIVDELGDTFWGLVGVMNEFNISFEELCEYNMKKLTERNS
jgi:NTP pyrophosphatase (non-canonical NTP hydrolase)